MNHVLDVIKSRRSIRKFRSEQIKDDDLQKILDAALHAPTGHNDQPWYFTVIQDKKLIDYIGKKTKELMSKSDIGWVRERGKNENFNLFYNAPTVIIVSGKKDAYSPLTDCSAAIQNMLLAAESLGIGSCWIGLVSYFFSEKQEVDKLNMPSGYEPYYAVCLGYKDPSVKTVMKERRKDVVKYISQN